MERLIIIVTAPPKRITPIPMDDHAGAPSANTTDPPTANASVADQYRTCCTRVEGVSIFVT